MPHTGLRQRWAVLSISSLLYIHSKYKENVVTVYDHIIRQIAARIKKVAFTCSWQELSVDIPVTTYFSAAEQKRSRTLLTYHLFVERIERRHTGYFSATERPHSSGMHDVDFMQEEQLPSNGREPCISSSHILQIKHMPQRL